MIIAFVHTKGGVAKTTSALMVGFVAAARGVTVSVYDADRQGSAAEWINDLDEGVEAPFVVHRARHRVIRELGYKNSGETAELVIIDTPPGDSAAIDAAIEVADMVIVPTGTTPLDIKRVWPTLEVTATRPTAVLLTATDPRTRLYREAREVFATQGTAVFETAIPQREGLRNLYGEVPDKEFFGYEELYDEIRAAAREIGV